VEDLLLGNRVARLHCLGCLCTGAACTAIASTHVTCYKTVQSCTSHARPLQSMVTNKPAPCWSLLATWLDDQQPAAFATACQRSRKLLTLSQCFQPHMNHTTTSYTKHQLHPGTAGHKVVAMERHQLPACLPACCHDVLSCHLAPAHQHPRLRCCLEPAAR
jgi:hypothetical protein